MAQLHSSKIPNSWRQDLDLPVVISTVAELPAACLVMQLSQQCSWDAQTTFTACSNQCSLGHSKILWHCSMEHWSPNPD